MRHVKPNQEGVTNADILQYVHIICKKYRKHIHPEVKAAHPLKMYFELYFKDKTTHYFRRLIHKECISKTSTLRFDLNSE